MVKNADHSAVIFGTHFPNRIFVGCLPSKATAHDLAEFFSHFGVVSEAKIVLDETGGSKRFGFVSFCKEEDVNTVLKHGSIFFWGKQINVGPAVKKKLQDDVKGQPATLMFDESTLNVGNKSRVVYHPLESCPYIAAQRQAPLTIADAHPFPFLYSGDHFQPCWQQDLHDIYHVPHCSTEPLMTTWMPPSMHSQPYLMSSRMSPYAAPVFLQATDLRPSNTAPPTFKKTAWSDPVHQGIRSPRMKYKLMRKEKR